MTSLRNSKHTFEISFSRANSARGLFTLVLSAFFLIFSASGCNKQEDEEDFAAECGSVNGKIINGEACGEGSSVVRLIIAEQALCTGTMLTPRHVLTAAHCLSGEEIPVRPRDIRLTDDDLSSTLAVGSRISLHPGYAEGKAAIERLETENPTNDPREIERILFEFFGRATVPDIAVLTLDRDLGFPTLAVETRYRPLPGDGFQAFGYGRTGGADEASGEELQVTSAVTTFSGPGNFISTFVSSGLCLGDSGGPAVLPGAGGGEGLVIGVNSALVAPNVDNGGGCAPGDFDIFAALATEDTIEFLRSAAPGTTFN